MSLVDDRARNAARDRLREKGRGRERGGADERAKNQATDDGHATSCRIRVGRGMKRGPRRSEV